MRKNEQGKAEGNEVREIRSCGNILEKTAKLLGFLLSTRERFYTVLNKEVTGRRSLAQIDFCFIIGGQNPERHAYWIKAVPPTPSLPPPLV